METIRDVPSQSIDQEPNHAEHWQFIGTHLFHDAPSAVEVEADADAVVQELLQDPEDPNGKLDEFLHSRGNTLAARAARYIERDPDNPEHVERSVVSAAFDFSRGYKQVAMGPLAFYVAEEIVASNPRYMVQSSTASGSFTATIGDWYSKAVASVGEDVRHAAAWSRFQHAIDVTRTIRLEYPDVSDSRVSWVDRDPQRWLTGSFINPLSFVSDLLIQVAVGYARYHPDEVSAENLTAAAREWLPYLAAIESTFSGTQDTVTFGPELKKRRQRADPHAQLPTTRWLSALESFEGGEYSKLERCVEEYASAILLNSPEPGPVHSSLKDGRLPEKRSGHCGARFIARTAIQNADLSPENKRYPSPAELSLQSSINVAAQTIFADPTCQKAILHAAHLLSERAPPSSC